MEKPQSKYGLAFIFVVVLLDVLGIGLLVPIVPYIVREFRSDALTVGLLTVAYAVAQFFAAPLLGRISDRVGRKPVLLICLLGSAVGYAIFGIGGALWVLFLSRVIDGITGGNISVASAYIADVSAPEDRAKNFALLGAAFGLGFILGPAISGLLVPFGLNAPVFAAAALSLTSALVGFAILPESLPPAARNHAPFQLADVNPFGATFELLRRPTLGMLLVAGLVFNFVFAAYVSNVIVFFIERFQVDAGVVSVLLVVGGVVRVLMFPIVGKIVPLFGEKNLAITGLVLQALTLLAVALAPEWWMQIGAVILNSIASALIFATLGALAANQVQPAEQGKLQGVNTALGGLGNIAGPLWGGVAYDSLSPLAPYLSGALLLIVGALLIVPLRLTRSQSAEQATA